MPGTQARCIAARTGRRSCHTLPAPGILILFLLLAGPTTPLAQSLDPISYTVRFPAPATHYAEVEAVIPVDGRAAVELMMAGPGRPAPT